MVALGVGRIVWAVYSGRRGDGKRRPMILMSSRAEIARTGKAFAVVCSTDFAEPLRDNEILVPSYADHDRCPTGLESRTVAICDWTDIISVGNVRDEDRAGLVPTDVMKAICEKIGIPLRSDRG